MDLKTRFLRLALLGGLASISLLATPQLRLNTTSIGPISLNPDTRFSIFPLTASNGGDGDLSITVSSSATWMIPSTLPYQGCGLTSCIPIPIILDTKGLANGTYQGRITVNAAGALDAPQFVDVTITVGGATLPDKIDFYLPPLGGTASRTFYLSAGALVNPVVIGGGSTWLTVTNVAPTAGGTNQYRVTVNSANLGEGNYTGTLNVTGSNVSAENKPVSVALHVLSQPIAQVPVSPVAIRLATNAAAQEIPVPIPNAGVGTLNLTGATVKLDSGAWLTARTDSKLLYLKFSSAGRQAGVYNGTVTLTSNGANASATIPVQLTVVDAAAPLAGALGAVDNATFEQGGTVSPGMILAIFGEQFTTGEPLLASNTPLPTKLGNTRVLVNGTAAPLYYSSYGQINFQLPFEATTGEASVRVERDGQLGNPVSLRVAAQAPRILTLLGGPYAIAVNQDGSFAAPSGYGGLNAHPAKPGDVLVLYAIGLGQTAPYAQTGVASSVNPLQTITGSYVTLGEPNPFLTQIYVPTDFAGLTPGYVGLYQINFQVPASSPKGDVVAIFLLNNGTASNRVQIAVQ